MTKEITKSIILQEIQDKLKLREFESAKFLLDETVVPVYDIGYHLGKRFIEMKTVSITAGPDAYVYFTVPENERWAFSNYNITFVTGVYGVTGLFITRASSGAGAFLYLDQKLGQTSSYPVNLGMDVVLDAGDNISIFVDAYTSTGDLRLGIDVTKEEIR